MQTGAAYECCRLMLQAKALFYDERFRSEIDAAAVLGDRYSHEMDALAGPTQMACWPYYTC